MSASSSHSRSSSNTTGPNLQQFVESVPPPITLLLVKLSYVIHILRRTLEIFSWEAHWSESWLMLAAWWATCLLTYGFVKYLLPAMLMLPAFWTYLYSSPPKRTHTPPVTEQTLAIALTDIDIICSLLPSLPQPPDSLRSFRAALRVSAILSIPYVILTYVVPLKILIGIAGTFLLVYRATWARTIGAVLGSSAFLQRAFRFVWAKIVGPLNPVLEASTFTDAKAASSVLTPSEPQRFLFTILECQRWWVGLDWTAALLPGERPSWCNVAQQPVSPPSAFELPCSSIVYLPRRNGKRIKRTATWRWEDQQWGIMVNKDGVKIFRLEKNPPGEEEDKDNSSTLKRAATLLRERSIYAAIEKDKDKEKEEGANNSNVPDAEDVATDADGWVYGDNKWEATNSKSGLGKYTRYRRWTRVAILEETVEEIGPGALALGVVKDAQSLMRNSQAMKEAQTVITDAIAFANMKTSPERLSTPQKSQRSVSNSVSTPSTVTLGSQETPGKSGQGSHHQDDSGVALRERLKSAIKNAK